MMLIPNRMLAPFRFHFRSSQPQGNPFRSRTGRLRPALLFSTAIALVLLLALVLPGTAARPDGTGTAELPAGLHAASGRAVESSFPAAQSAISSADASLSSATALPPGSGSASTPGSAAGGTAGSTAGGSLRVHFLDVAQGSATLFEIGDKVLLIDGGDRDRASFVVAYLKQHGIRQVDVMVATHYDDDHLNGLVGVLNVFPVGQVFDARYIADTRVFASFREAIRSRGIPEQSPAQKQTIRLGGADITFVAPKAYGHAAENDDSICVRVAFGQTSFLIMGDPSADAEQQMLAQNLKSDVLLAAHHGSDGSSSSTLLANVRPAYAVISCGAGNPYGHPGSSTLNRIRTVGAALYRTDRQGTIICTSNGQTLAWDKQPCNDFTPGSATAGTTAGASAATTAAGTAASTAGGTSAGGTARSYVLNISTRKFHLPSCSSVPTIKASNRRDVTETRDSILAQGYSPCGICHP